MPYSGHSGLPDEELVKAILQNEEDAFKAIYYKYFNALIRFAWFRVHSMDLCRDLVQETFFQVWKRRTSLDPKKSIKAYLYKTLTNLIVNHRKLSSTRTTSLESITQEDRLDEVSSIELKIDLQKALDKVPAKFRDVYMLSRFDGYKYTEIAEICGISVKAVEKRMSAAFANLRKTLGKKY